ncbi:MAG: VOC family protein [Acidobacteriaceae bacterium]|jgi:catechol 2,3-dioxygenase-like lactoylglutathione lyase family enzyme
MVTSIHTLIYSDDAPATRAFLRDVLGWPYVEDAAGGGEGWLIFKTGPSEMGVHPTHSVYDGKTYESPRHHLISLMCDRACGDDGRTWRGRHHAVRAQTSAGV